MKGPFVVGLDIGYSNLKVVSGRKGSMKRTVLPVGAGPATLLPRDIRGGAVDAIYVRVDGEEYAAGVEPDRLQSWERELHASYTSTKSYKALFLAALLTADTDEVDVLVTGLPVSQFKDEKHRQALVELMQGTHHVTPEVSVKVNRVEVVPQPAGAYVEAVSNHPDTDTIELFDEGRTLILDPGFFSTDWISMLAGEIQYEYSGTSQEAVSAILESVAAEIQKDFGTYPRIDMIEKAIRSERPHIFLNSRKIILERYMADACRKVPEVALTALKRTLRKDDMQPDVIVLAGGGGKYYEAAAKAVYPEARIVLPKSSLMAIAEGYWQLGA